MKKIILCAFLLFHLGQVSAEYSLRFPLEVNNGGILPTGSIKFKPNDWQPASPFISDWVVSGSPYNCQLYPQISSLDIDSYYITTRHQYNSCKQNYTRTVQQREINTLNNEYRFIGEPVEESKTGYVNDPPSPVKAFTCAYDIPTHKYYYAIKNGVAHVSWNAVIYSDTSGYYRGKLKTTIDDVSYYVVCEDY